MTTAELQKERRRITEDYVGQIKGFMRKKGISNTQLASRLHISSSRVSQIMSGRYNLSLRTIVNLARAIGVKVAIVGTKEQATGDSIRASWECAGQPASFWELEAPPPATQPPSPESLPQSPATEQQRGGS